MDSRVEIGLGLQSNKRHDDYARLATAAEGYGFDLLTVFGDLLFQPPTIYPLLTMAQATSRVRLDAACMNPYTMHPYEIAGQVASLQQTSGGRAYLGLARGAWLGQIGIRQTKPPTHLREAAQVIRALLRDEGEGVAGEVFGLAAAGRSDDAVGLTVGAVTVVDQDGAAARAKARTEVAMYLAVVAALDPTAHVPPDQLSKVKKHVDAGEYERAGTFICEDVLDQFAFSGTSEQVAAQAQRLIDAGARRIEFGTPHGLTDAVGVELLGRGVLPMLDRRSQT